MTIRRPLAIALLALGGLAACQPAPGGGWVDPRSASGGPQEDSPGFNCTRHGNGICGPVQGVLRRDGWVDAYDGKTHRHIAHVRLSAMPRTNYQAHETFWVPCFEGQPHCASGVLVAIFDDNLRVEGAD